MIERIASPKKTREIIEKNQFYFKKNFGQNFLIDSNILEAIVESASITEDDFVLEIGPGIGSLTQVLAEHAKQVICVEIDNHLIPILTETLKDYSNIEIMHGDILKININQLIAEKNEDKPIKVVANLPYYITTPIIMDLLENQRKVSSITVMVQKEVADRMQAAPKSKDYGALTVAVQYYCNTEINKIVPPSCFMPQPKVASAVITLHVGQKPNIEVADEKLFFHIVKCAFGQRRKTLLNCLFNQGGFSFSKEDIVDILQECGLDEKIRGEALSLQDFGTLCNVIHAKL